MVMKWEATQLVYNVSSRVRWSNVCRIVFAQSFSVIVLAKATAPIRPLARELDLALSALLERLARGNGLSGLHAHEWIDLGLVRLKNLAAGGGKIASLQLCSEAFTIRPRVLA